MSVGPRRMMLAAAVLALLLAGGLAVEIRAARQSLQAQLEARSRDAAAVVAAALLHAGADHASWLAIARAQFAAGHTQRLQLRFAEGGAPPFVDLQRPVTAVAAPGWFLRTLPLQGRPGTATLRVPGEPAVELELDTDPTWAQDVLWDSATRTSGVALVLLLSLALVVASARRPAVRSAGPVSPDDTPPPGPRPAASGADAASRSSDDEAVLRPWREAVAAQSGQVAQLQRQAQQDTVTGLPLRGHFVGLLQQRLQDGGSPALALLIVRVLDLEAVNLRLGREATDRLLGAVADVLQTYVDRVPGTLAGRLNGADFALCLPVAGVAAETAASLRTALAAAPAVRAGHAEVAVGGAEGVHHTSAGAALAAADAALARAETADEGATGIVVLHAVAQGMVPGARVWYARIEAALTEGRACLDAAPVLDALRRQPYLECALRLQLQTDGPFEPAELWRAPARRGKLLPRADLVAVELALEAIAQDGLARAVHISRSSLAVPGFVADVATGLAAAPAAARRLALECVDDLRVSALTAPLAAAASAWGPWGVRLGVGCGADAAQQLPALQQSGVHYVKLDALQLQGLAGDEALRRYAEGLVALVHGLGLTLVVTGVQSANDAAALWALGIDAASGPAIAALVAAPPSA